MKRSRLRLTLLGIGAMNSPRYAPAGLLVVYGCHRIMLDGGPSAVPSGKLDAWLVSDERGELMREIRRLAVAKGLEAQVASYSINGLFIDPHLVTHTSHDAYGYGIETKNRKAIWAPEFFAFPAWAKNADIMFAEASSWNRPIYFRGGVGGHACVLDVAREAQKLGVKRLIFAHIGRPTIKAIDAGKRAPFGEFGREGATYTL
ncbi:MAG: hypothetical protein ACRD6N_16130 [Pyrinomonadaceae bacterium]